MFVALIEVHQAMKQMRSQLINTVHDSLMIDCCPGEEDAVKTLVLDIMRNPDTEKYGYKLDVPLLVDVEEGINWGELKEVG
jgi:DNA polymerase I-like protein with 3'-5' exonuclease and polymerase domains